MSRPKVLVTQEIPKQGLEPLQRACEVTLLSRDGPPPRKKLLVALPRHEALLCLLTDRIDEEVISRNPNLKIIANYAVGFDNIDVAAATKAGIPVTNTPGVLTETTADFAWALLMSCARRIPEADRYTRAGKFRWWGPLLLLGQDVYGKTMGIVGFGRIGQAVAKRAKGFGMRILYHDVNRATPLAEQETGASFVPLADLLRESDFVSLHVNLTPQSRHLIGEKELRLMKPTAILVNTSRGPVVDEKALVRVLKERRIFAAGLDVYENEPKLAPGLARLPNVVLAPHIASASEETRGRMAEIAAKNILERLAGGRPPNVVNPEALP